MWFIRDYFRSQIGEKKKHRNFGLLSAEPEVRPQYEEHFDKENNTIIRLVSKKKTNKVYQVAGIADIASKNNWKAWIYLGPVIVLLTIFKTSSPAWWP